MNRTLRPLLVGLMCVAAAGCGEGDGSGRGGAKSALDSAMGSASDAGQQAVETIRQQFTKQAGDYQGQIDALKAKAAGLSDQKLNDLLASLDAKLGQARTKIDQLRNSSGGTTQTLQTELNAIMGDLKKLYDQAEARLNQLGK